MVTLAALMQFAHDGLVQVRLCWPLVCWPGQQAAPTLIMAAGLHWSVPALHAAKAV